MATITLEYNARSSAIRRMLAALLDSGLFRVVTNPGKTRSTANIATLQAIEEAKRGEYAGVVDTSSIDAMVASITQ